MRLRNLVVTIAITALVIAGGAPASATDGGSDGSLPYAVTNDGIQLPPGDTFPDGGHVNLNTSVGSKSIHFESLNQADDSVKKKYIGEGFIPWSAFGLDLTTACVTWVQVSLYNQHFGEGGQAPVGQCGTTPDPSGEKKITFCHATSSDTNPYVTVTTSLAAFYQAGHINDDAHHSGVDIYPAGSFTHPTKGTVSWDAQGDQSLLAYEDCVLPPPDYVTPAAPEWVDSCEADGMWVYSDTAAYKYVIADGMITAVPLGETVFDPQAVVSWATPAEDEGLECEPVMVPVCIDYEMQWVPEDQAGQYEPYDEVTCTPPPVYVTPPAPEWVDSCEADGVWTFTDTEAYQYVVGDGMITVIALGETLFDPQAVTEWATPAEDEGLECDDGTGDKKITFCHATGSESNPYVTITTSLAAFYQAGHINDDEHHSGVDIYPAGTFNHPTKGAISWEAQGDQSLLQYEDCVKPLERAIITAPTWVDPCDADNAYWDVTSGIGYTWSATAVLGGAITVTATPLPGYYFAKDAQTEWTGYDSGELCEVPMVPVCIDYMMQMVPEDEADQYTPYDEATCNPPVDICVDYEMQTIDTATYMEDPDSYVLYDEETCTPPLPEIWVCTYTAETGEDGTFVGVEGQGPSLVDPSRLTGLPGGWDTDNARWYLLDGEASLAYVLGWDDGQTVPDAEDCFQTAHVTVGDWVGEPECNVDSYVQTSTQIKFVYSLQPVWSEGGIITVLERLIDTIHLAPLTQTVQVEDPEPCVDANVDLSVLAASCEAAGDVDTVTATFAEGPSLADLKAKIVDGTIVPGSAYSALFTPLAGHVFDPAAVDSAAGEMLLEDGSLMITFTVPAQLVEGCEEPVEPTLDATLTSVCEDDVPYLDYSIVLTDPDDQVTATNATLTFTKGANTFSEPASLSGGRITWPGFEQVDGVTTAYPGWKLVDGEWVSVGDDLLGWTRQADLTVSVNPEITLSVTYPPGDGCLPPTTVDETLSATAAVPVVAEVTYTG